MSLDLEPDDLPAGYGEPFEALNHALRLWLPSTQRRSELGFTARTEDKLTKQQRYAQTPNGRENMLAAARRNAAKYHQRVKGTPEYRARKAAEARRRRAALRLAGEWGTR